MISRSVAIVGGGIAGIAAALERAKAGDEVHLFERELHLGGKLGETVVDGVTIPTAADNFLARRPEVSDLATELGLGDRLIHPSAGSARIYRDGLLHPLPTNVLGVPATPDLAATGLISIDGAQRAANDLHAPDDAPTGDESVGTMVRRRFGDEVLEYLVDPLLGGINAGDSDQLSVESGVPQLDALRRRGASLIEAARATLAEGPTNPGPVFSSIDGGLNRLVDRAFEVLDEHPSVDVHTGVEATIEHITGGFAVAGIEVERVIVATPAAPASSLVKVLSPRASRELAAIEYSSVGLALLVLPPGTVKVGPSISGVLVPRLCGLHVTAISFASHKWPKMAGDDRQILRVSVGRRADTRWQAMEDDEILEIVRADVSTVLGDPIPSGPATFARWMQGLPQYDVNHAARVARIDEAVRNIDGLSFVGAWRHGLGLPACVASGRGV